MKTPPYNQIYSIAKHGSDDELCAHRDDIRWLACWVNDAQSSLAVALNGSTISVGPERWDKEADGAVRPVTITALLTTRELQDLLSLWSADEDD